MKNYTKIVTVADFYFFLLLEFNCVTLFDTCCIDRDKVTVKFCRAFTSHFNLCTTEIPSIIAGDKRSPQS